MAEDRPSGAPGPQAEGRPPPPPPRPAAPPSKPKGPGIPWGLLVVTAILGYAVAFVFVNDHEVEVDFVFVSARTPLVFVIVLALVFGLLVGLLVPFVQGRRRRRRAAGKS